MQNTVENMSHIYSTKIENETYFGFGGKWKNKSEHKFILEIEINIEKHMCM